MPRCSLLCGLWRWLEASQAAETALSTDVGLPHPVLNGQTGASTWVQMEGGFRRTERQQRGAGGYGKGGDSIGYRSSCSEAARGDGPLPTPWESRTQQTHRRAAREGANAAGGRLRHEATGQPGPGTCDRPRLNSLLRLPSTICILQALIPSRGV